MTSRPELLVALGLVVGLVVGVVGGTVATGPQSSVSVPSQTTWATTGCAREEPSAWVGQTQVLDFAVVEFQNYSFTHEAASIEVRTTLDQRAPGEWVLAHATAPDENASRKSPPDDCQPRTRLGSSVALPRDFSTLTVTLDGEVVTVVDGADQPRFRPLAGANESRATAVLGRPGGL